MLSFGRLLWIFLLLSFTVVATPALNSPSPFHIPGVRHELKRDAGGLWPARRNINDLVQDIPQWSLFVQAFSQFQQLPESYFYSFHEIAGIHGRPFYSWNFSPQGGPNTGYCTHGSVLFLAWHRPYIALFEQIIASLAQDLVASYPTSMQATYQVAAVQLRFPFWDWASDIVMPPIVSQSTTAITNTAGQRQIVNNPLYTYRFQNFPMDTTNFPSGPGAPDGWLANYTQTMRGLNTRESPSNSSVANGYLGQFGLQRGIWYALTRNAGLYNNFSTTATQGTSLEAVHNNVHAAVGAFYGHMSILSYSAFDPVFWLHHANVDRLYALWQAMNPNSWMTPGLTEPAGTFAIARGVPESADTPLEPFSSSGDSSYYTPNTSRMPAVFGYTYPEIPDWTIPAAQLTAQVTAQVHSLYNPNNQYKKRGVGSSTGQFKEWFVRVQLNKFVLLGERFSVHVFIEHVPENPNEWLSSPNKVGSMTIFPPPHTDGTTMPDIPAHAEFSIVEALNERGQDEENVEAVSEYLTKHLLWRVQTFDGVAVDAKKLSSLVVSVQHEIVHPGKDNTELPAYSDIVVVPEITIGKAGGFSG